MVSIDSSGRSAVLKESLRAAVEGAALAGAVAVGAGLIWTDGRIVAGARIGATCAWAASAASVAWLLWARERSTEAFWWSFGGGMALRAATLAALTVWGVRRGSSMEALLLSYVFALILILLTLEMKHLRLK